MQNSLCCNDGVSESIIGYLKRCLMIINTRAVSKNRKIRERVDSQG